MMTYKDLFTDLYLCGAVLMLLLSEFHQCLTDGQKIARKLTKEGFHRDVETNVTFEDSNDRDCQYLLRESLPAGCYVDVYEISRIGTPKIWTDGVINLESPEYLSTDHKIYIYLDRNEKGIAEIRLPVHLRYHRPTFDSEFAQVHIPNPKLYTSCTDKSLGVSVTIPCNNTTGLCTWSEIPYTPDSGTLTASVPVGQITNKSLVVVVTLGVTWTGFFFLLYYISSKSLYHVHID